MVPQLQKGSLDFVAMALSIDRYFEPSYRLLHTRWNEFIALLDD